MPLRALLTITLFLLATVATAAVYKCPDGKGGSMFQDMPCADSAVPPIMSSVPTAKDHRNQETGTALRRLGQHTLPPDYQRAIDARLAQILKDPDSRKVAYLGSYGSAACGTVNAKNGFGGYTGPRLFVARFMAGKGLPAVEIFSEDTLQTTLALHTVAAHVLSACGVNNPYP